MDLINPVRKFVLGVHYSQEYLCVEKESFQHAFKTMLLDEDKGLIADVSEKHLLLGYKPVLIGIPLDETAYLAVKEKGTLLFTYQGKKIAELELEKIFSKSTNGSAFVLFQSLNGKHQLISKFYQRLNNFRERLRRKKEGNIFLEKNLYDQVRIGYAVPRTISMVTVSDGEKFNLFPTDLHGSINQDYYVDSLRIDGNAGKQVESAGRMIISEVDAQFFREAYSLGKNHMADLQLPVQFPFSDIHSEKFNLLIPQHAISYRELELERTKDFGIHRFYFFNVIHQKKIKTESLTLAHVHRYVAEWRRKNGIDTNYLIR